MFVYLGLKLRKMIETVHSRTFILSFPVRRQYSLLVPISIWLGATLVLGGSTNFAWN
jgi:hypothetical protein